MQLQRSPVLTRNRGRSDPLSTHSNAEETNTGDPHATGVLSRLEQLEHQLSENRNQMAQIIELLQSTGKSTSTIHNGATNPSSDATSRDVGNENNNQADRTQQIASNSPKELNVKPRKPNVYAGDRSVDATLWINQMRSYLSLARVERVYWVEFAATFLEKDAAQWWQGHQLATSRNSQQFDWDEFRVLFLNRFQPIAASQVAYNQLLNWKQTGSVRSYIDGFINLSAHIPYDILPEKARVLNFVTNLKSNLRQLVQLKEPKTIQDAILAAQLCADAATPSYRIPALPANPRVSSNFDGRTSVIDRTRHTPIHVDKIEQLSSTAFKDKKCFYCQRAGHFAKNCFQRKRDISTKNKQASASHLN